jgi:hypothetical protein
MQDSVSELANPGTFELRKSTCQDLADALSATGAVLWAFGAAEQPRRSIAVAIQMGGETARGAVSLMRDGNRYGAAALVRQLVEIEYLLCLFTIDKAEPLRWSSLGLDAVRKEYQPARMRERCGDRFRSSEYSIHCQVGGHPRFAAAYILPEHLRIGPWSDDVIFAAGWVDLGQHLVAIWRWLEDILHAYDLMHVGLARSSLDKAKLAVMSWLRDDPCAARLNEAEVEFLAQVSSKNEVSH